MERALRAARAASPTRAPRPRSSTPPPRPGCSTSPTRPWTPRSARWCSPPRRRGWRVSPMSTRGRRTRCWRTSPQRLSPRMLAAPRRLDGPRRELDEYFAGRRQTFELHLDLRLLTDFARRVLSATAAIPYGGVATYREVAAAAGSPRGSRAAGNALGSNPLPIVLPCHRVLHSGGGPGRLHRAGWRASARCWRSRAAGAECDRSHTGAPASWDAVGMSSEETR